MANTLKEVLMKRDGLTEQEADERVNTLRETMMNYIDEGDMDGAYNVCEEEGLEPDYLEDLI